MSLRQYRASPSAMVAAQMCGLLFLLAWQIYCTPVCEANFLVNHPQWLNLKEIKPIPSLLFSSYRKFGLASRVGNDMSQHSDGTDFKVALLSSWFLSDLLGSQF